MAGEVLARAKERAESMGRAPKTVAIVTSETPATMSYLRIKERRAADAGCVLEVVRLPENTSTAELVATVLSASADSDAIIVQLPLAYGVDTKAVCDAIPVSKDADVLSSVARARFESGFSTSGVNASSKTPDVFPPLLPPVVGAVREILKKNNVEVDGKRAVVIGEGWLVGKPCATWLAQQGAEVQVLTIQNSAEEKAAALRAAHIIISGAGSPHLIKPDMLTRGVVLIDAGTSELGGEVVGDADPACAEVCSLFTPVPGGIGPLAVACLFENVVSLAEK